LSYGPGQTRQVTPSRSPDCLTNHRREEPTKSQEPTECRTNPMEAKSASRFSTYSRPPRGMVNWAR